jgi:hypothetical protein
MAKNRGETPGIFNVCVVLTLRLGGGLVERFWHLKIPQDFSGVFSFL